jgi:hypothetical protein
MSPPGPSRHFAASQPNRTSASGLQNPIYECASKREGFWKIEEPEIAAVFEGRDFAYFKAERVSDEEIRIIRRVEDQDW